MSLPGAGARIQAAILGLEGVTVQSHRFGGLEWLGRREIGHVHDDSLVDIPYPRGVCDQVIAAGQAQAHHILPESGWVSHFLRAPADVDTAIALLHLSYDLARHQRRQAAPDSS